MHVAVVTTAGRLLIFPLSELPQLNKGKGNKLIAIPKADWEANTESVSIVYCFQFGEALEIVAGKRSMLLRANIIADFCGKRAQRGRMLPRGYRRVDIVRTSVEKSSG